MFLPFMAGGSAESSASGTVAVEAGTAELPTILTADRSGDTITNTGAAANTYVILPDAAIDLEFCLVNTSATFQLYVYAASGETIIAGSSGESDPGGGFRTQAIGESATVKCVHAGSWVIIASSPGFAPAMLTVYTPPE